MNFRRLVVAALVAWFADMAFGFVVYGNLMAGLFADHATVFRPQNEINMALGFMSSLVGFFVFAYMYAKGYEGGNGIHEGLRFGVLVGLLLVCFSAIWNYVVFRLSENFGAAAVVVTLVEMPLMGMIVGYLYKPAGVAQRKSAVV